MELLATTKAFFEWARSAVEFARTYSHYREDRETLAESRRVSRVFSTYSEDEIRAAAARLRDCYERFVREGSGPQRVRCICSVLDDFRVGNGGELPLIDDWEGIYRQLRCRDLS